MEHLLEGCELEEARIKSEEASRVPSPVPEGEDAFQEDDAAGDAEEGDAEARDALKALTAAHDFDLEAEASAEADDDSNVRRSRRVAVKQARQATESLSMLVAEEGPSDAAGSAAHWRNTRPNRRRGAVASGAGSSDSSRAASPVAGDLAAAGPAPEGLVAARVALSISGVGSTGDGLGALSSVLASRGAKHLGGLGALNWCEAEDRLLISAVEEAGMTDWTRVCSHLRGHGFSRSAQQCMARYMRALGRGPGRSEFTAEEDEMIRAEVKRAGGAQKVAWRELAAKVGGRLGKQCRERWFFHLDPAILRTPFSVEDDKTLFTLRCQLGNRWAMIAQRMPGRTENSCKNRWFSASRRKWCAENGIDAESPDGKLKYGAPQLRNLPIRE